jgi:hypothetical protein
VPYTSTIESGPTFLADRVDYQCVALIMANGLALPGGRWARSMGHVHAYTADLMITEIQHSDFVALLYHLDTEFMV